jgi:hypothetical protein
MAIALASDRRFRGQQIDGAALDVLAIKLEDPDPAIHARWLQAVEQQLGMTNPEHFRVFWAALKRG